MRIGNGCQLRYIYAFYGPENTPKQKNDFLFEHTNGIGMQKVTWCQGNSIEMVSKNDNFGKKIKHHDDSLMPGNERAINEHVMKSKWTQRMKKVTW